MGDSEIKQIQNQLRGPQTDSDIDLSANSLGTSNWLKLNVGIPALLALGACTMPKMSCADELSQITPQTYPELKILKAERRTTHLNVFCPDPSLGPERAEEYKAFSILSANMLWLFQKNPNYIVMSADARGYLPRIALELGDYTNLKTADLFLIKPDNSTEGKRLTAERVDEYDVTILPKNAKLERESALRIFVADGAYLQAEIGCMSRWTLAAAETLQKRLPGLAVDVKALRYREKTSIKNSARTMAEFIINDLKSNPLKDNEQIIFLGHSQGAFIMSFLSKCIETGEDFAKEIPWDKVNKVISVDLPMNVTHDYQGNWEFLIDPALFVARNDIILFPLLCEIFFPVGNDYLRNTDVYSIIEDGSDREFRIQRKMKDGSYAHPTRPEMLIDDHNHAFDHHPFLNSRGGQNREVRERVIKLILDALPLGPKANENDY
jgi:hypothetical protein